MYMRIEPGRCLCIIPELYDPHFLSSDACRIAHFDGTQSVMDSSEFGFELIGSVWQNMCNQEVNFDLGSSERNFESGGGIGTLLLPSEPR